MAWARLAELRHGSGASGLATGGDYHQQRQVGRVARARNSSSAMDGASIQWQSSSTSSSGPARRLPSHQVEQQRAQQLGPGLRVERPCEAAIGHRKAEHGRQQRSSLRPVGPVGRHPAVDLGSLLVRGQRRVHRQQAAHDGPPDEVAGGGAVGSAGAAMDREPQALADGDGLGHQPRLADAGLAGEAEHLAAAGKGAPRHRMDGTELGVTADQPTHRQRLRQLEPRPLPGGTHGPGAHWSGLALDGDRPEAFADGASLDPLEGRAVDQQLSRLRRLRAAARRGSRSRRPRCSSGAAPTQSRRRRRIRW